MREIKLKSFFLVIPTRDRAEHVKNLLGDLIPFGDYISNCVIVDQSICCLSSDFCQENYPFPITIVEGLRDQGVNHSRNLALKLYNDEDWLFFLDDDLRVLEQEINKIPKVLSESSVNVLVLGINEERTNNNEKRYTDLLETISKPNKPSNTRMRLQVSSGLSIVEKEYFYKAGFYFDEKYTFWGDDWDFGFRLLAAGAIILHYPDINFRHLEIKHGGQRRYSNQKNNKLTKKYLQLYFYKKHFSDSAVKEKFYYEIFRSIKHLRLLEALNLLKYYNRL